VSPWRRSRATLAWVLGSLDSELATRNLLVALDASSYDTTIPRWLVYALGIWNGDLTRENRFDFSLESPLIVEGPTGLRVPIACRIDDEDAVTALVPLLEHEDLELRRAAIASSRHSLYVDRLREAFRHRLPVESEVGNQAEVAEALADWAHSSGGSLPEAATVVAEIISEARIPDRHLLRLKVQPHLRGVPIEPAQIEASQRVASGIDGDVSAQALVDALHQYTAWNVRFAAARELGALHTRSSAALVRTALKSAMLNDQDSRVRQVAQRSLGSKLPSTD